MLFFSKIKLSSFCEHFTCLILIKVICSRQPRGQWRLQKKDPAGTTLLNLNKLFYENIFDKIWASQYLDMELISFANLAKFWPANFAQSKQCYVGWNQIRFWCILYVMGHHETSSKMQFELLWKNEFRKSCLILNSEFYSYTISQL